jgi:hypothetical protein
MNVKVTGESERITLGDLAGRIGTGKVDIHSNDWGRTDAEQRRKIAESYTPDKALAALLEMAADYLIRPRYTANGEPLKTPPDSNSWLTGKDGDIAVECLRKAVDWDAFLLAQEEAQEKARREAGRYTIEDAAKELAADTGLNVDRWRKTLVAEVKQGKLLLRNPRDFEDWLPYAVPDDDDLRTVCEQVTGCDLNRLLESHAEWQVPYRFATADAPAKAKKEKLQTKHQQMVSEFRRVIAERGFNPDALPPEKRGNGDSGLRSMVAEALNISPSKSFQRHWERAFEKGEISWADKSK